MVAVASLRHCFDDCQCCRWQRNPVRTVTHPDVAARMARRCETIFGWRLHLTTSPNKRTLYNFPVQGGAAEMLRLAAWRLCEAGLVPNMLVHDGILFELENQEQVAQAVDIMRSAGRDVCHGLEVGVDVDQWLEHGARYLDKRPMAKKMWATIMQSVSGVRLARVPRC